MAGRWEQSQRIYDGLVAVLPEQASRLGVRVRGMRAFVAVSRGDTVQAIEDAEWFELLEDHILRCKTCFLVASSPPPAVTGNLRLTCFGADSTTACRTVGGWWIGLRLSPSATTHHFRS